MVPLRLQPCSFAPVKLHPAKFAPTRLHPLRSAPERSSPRKSTRSSSEPCKLLPCSLHPVAPTNLSPVRSLELQSGRMAPFRRACDISHSFSTAPSRFALSRWHFDMSQPVKSQLDKFDPVKFAFDN
eukprot:768063-Hanusia_phi.AAC.6